MTRKRKIIFGSVAGTISVLIVAFAPIYPYRPYRILNPNDGWTPCDKWLTAEHCDRLAALLEDGGEWHFRSGQRLVLIPLRLKLDPEEAGNYSQKAEPEWTRADMDNITNNRGRPPSDFE